MIKKFSKKSTRALAAFMIAVLAAAGFPAVAQAASVSDLAPVTRMSYAELVGDNGDYREIPEPPPAGTYKIAVDITYQFITVYTKDDAGEYTVPVRYMPCSTGKKDTPTRTGTFKMPATKYRYKSFIEFPCAAQYWTRVVGGIYFHSILYSREDADYLQTVSYRNIGRRASHGCIRLLVPDARWIYYNIAPGTVCTIARGKKDSGQAAIKAQLKFTGIPKNKPNLNPASYPVTEAWPGYPPDAALPAGHKVAYIGEVISKAKVMPGASSVHRTIATLSKGTKVNILKDSYSATYYRILFGGYTAYVPVSQLSVTKANNPGWTTARTAKVQTTTAEVKVKNRAKSPVAFVLKQEDTVFVLAKDGVWARIMAASGAIGYIAVTDLKDIT